MEEEKEGLLGSVKKGLKKAVDTIASTLTQPESLTISEEFKNVIAEELVRRISAYYTGSEPKIKELRFTENDTGTEFNVTAQVTDLYSSSSGRQEAELYGEVEMPDVSYYHIPVPGAYGIDTFPPAPMPIMDYRPKINNVILGITKSEFISEVSFDRIQESLSRNFPHGKLIDKTTPLGLSEDALFCQRLISDAPSVLGAKGKSVLRYVKFPISKVKVDKEVDECLTIRDYEYQLQAPEIVSSGDFPRAGEIENILTQEKDTIRKKVFDGPDKGLFRGLRKMFFRIRVSSGKIVPNNNATEEELSFNVDFDCVSGVGPVSRVKTVPAVFYYSIEPKTMALKYLRHESSLD